MNITNIVTPKGAAVFPRLNKPDTKFVAEGEYSVKLRLDTSDEKVQEFLSSVEKAREASLGWAEEKLEEDLSKTQDPAKKGALKKKLGSLSLADTPVKPVLNEDGDETGHVEVRFKCKAQFTGKDGKTVKNRPSLVNAMKEVIDPEETVIGGGSVIKVAAAMYPYYNPKDNVSGVTFRLRAVQVLKLSSGGGGDFGFEAEESDEEATSSTATADF